MPLDGGHTEQGGGKGKHSRGVPHLGVDVDEVGEGRRRPKSRILHGHSSWTSMKKILAARKMCAAVALLATPAPGLQQRTKRVVWQLRSHPQAGFVVTMATG